MKLKYMRTKKVMPMNKLNKKDMTNSRKV